MKFLIKEKVNDRHFSLVHVEDEYSFNVKPFPTNLGSSSLSISCLQLQIDDDRRVVYVWGYEPLVQYEETEKFPEKYESKDLVAILEDEPIPGSAVSLVENSNWPDEPEWPTYINKKMGWACIGDPTIEGRRMIEFASDCIAALDDGNEMVAVWLHPMQLPSHLLKTTDDLR